MPLVLASRERRAALPRAEHADLLIMHDRHDANHTNDGEQRDCHDGQEQRRLGLLADAVEVRLGRHVDVGPVAGPAVDCSRDGGAVDAVEEGGCDDGGDDADEGRAEGEEGVEGGVVADLGGWLAGGMVMDERGRTAGTLPETRDTAAATIMMDPQATRATPGPALNSNGHSGSWKASETWVSL